MAVYNSAYKSGTIGSFSGTTVTASGFTPAAGDVGRILIINSGSAKFQHREITGVSGQDITIAHVWDTNPFIDPSSDSRATDVLPTNGDTIVVSYDLADLIAGDAQLTLTDENHILVSGVLEVRDGAYIQAKNFHIEWNSNEIGVGTDGGLILGYYGYVAGEDGYTKNSCDIIDNLDSLSGESLRRTTGSFGLFDMYGGSYYNGGTTGSFLRGYENTNNPTENQVRLINITQKGQVGGRYDGNRSMLIISAVGGSTSVGVANPLSPVARVELSVTGCDQAGYGHLGLAPSGSLVFPQLRDIANHVLRTTSSGTGVYTVIAKKSELDLVDPLASVESTSPNTTLRYGNLLSPTFIDAAGDPLSGTLVTKLYDDTATSVNDESVTGGMYTEFFARHTDIALTSGNKNLSDGTLYAPYTLRSIQYGKLFGLTNISAEDSFDSAVVILEDTTITEATQATVDAYTELETPQKLYDRAVSWLEQNITDETAFLFSRSGDLINAGGCDVEIDATAASVFAFDGMKMTLKASVFTGDITTTGTITLLNGAVNIGTLTDIGGVTTTLQYSITGLINNSRIQLYNVTTDSEILNVVNGTTLNGTYTEGVDFTIGDTVRLRVVNTIGLVSYKEYEATAVASASGFSFLVGQVLDAVYNDLAIDGSTITNFTADYVNDEVDITVSSNFTAEELYAWWGDNLMTSQGISDFYGGLTGVDVGNFRINNAVVNILFDNTTTTNVHQTDNRRIYREDNIRPVKEPTTGGGGIDIEWRSPVLIAESGVSGLTAQESTKLLSLDTSAVQTDLVGIESKVDLIEVKTEADVRQVDILLGQDGINSNLNDIAITGSPINATVLTNQLVSGVLESGTVDDTQTLDDLFHEFSDDSGSFENIYDFSVGSEGIPTSFEMYYILQGSNDSLDVEAYNFAGSSWQKVAQIDGANQATKRVIVASLTTAHVGTGGNLGDVRVRLVGTGLTNMDFKVDRALLGYTVIARSVGYAQGSIWVDTGSSNTGSTPFIDGVADNAVNSYANALSISDSVGLKKFQFSAADVITLTRDHDADTFMGHNFTINCNGNIPPTFSENCLMFGQTAGTQAFIVSGGAIGLTVAPLILETNAILLGCSITNIKMSDVMGSSLGVQMADGSGNAPDAMTDATLDFTTTAGTNHEVASARWSGPITFLNQKAGDTIYWHGDGTVILDSSCIGGTLRIAGTINIVDNSGGSVTIMNDAQLTKSGIASAIDTELTSSHGSGVWQSADVSSIETKTEADARQVLIAKEATKFDPSSDTVANVTLVATTTTNTDMRGTDGSNTVVPDNAGITANGVAISNLNDFDSSTDEVITDTASRDASKSDVSDLATKTDVIVASQL